MLIWDIRKGQYARSSIRVVERASARTFAAPRRISKGFQLLRHLCRDPGSHRYVCMA